MSKLDYKVYIEAAKKIHNNEIIYTCVAIDSLTFSNKYRKKYNELFTKTEGDHSLLISDFGSTFDNNGQVKLHRELALLFMAEMVRTKTYESDILDFAEHLC